MTTTTPWTPAIARVPGLGWFTGATRTGMTGPIMRLNEPEARRLADALQKEAKLFADHPSATIVRASWDNDGLHLVNTGEQPSDSGARVGPDSLGHFYVLNRHVTWHDVIDLTATPAARPRVVPGSRIDGTAPDPDEPDTAGRRLRVALEGAGLTVGYTAELGSGTESYVVEMPGGGEARICDADVQATYAPDLHDGWRCGFFPHGFDTDPDDVLMVYTSRSTDLDSDTATLVEILVAVSAHMEKSVRG